MKDDFVLDQPTARDILEVLNYFSIYSQSSEYKGVSREQITGDTISVIRKIPGFEKELFEEALKDDILKELLSKIAQGDITKTTPEELEKLLEEAEARKEAERLAKEKGEADVEKFLAQARESVRKRKGLEKESSSPPKEKSELISIVISPTSLSLEKFFAKAIAAPLKFIIDLGSSELQRTDANVTTAVWLMSQGVTSSSISQIVALARQKGISLSFTKLKKLEDLVKEHENITIYKILQLANRSELRLTQAEVAGITEVFLPTPAKAQTYTLSANQEAFGLPQETYQGGFAGSLAQTFVGKASSELLKRTLAPAAKELLVKGAPKLGIRLAAQAAGTTVPIIGNIVAFVATEIIPRLINLGKRFVSWLSRFLSGKGENKEGGLLLPVGLMAGGFLLMPISAPLGIAALGLGGLSALGQLGGISGATASAAGFFQNVINGLTGVVIPSIAKPIIISLITIPVVVAFIVFIINAGAYVVPPGTALPGVPLPGGPILTGCPAQMWPVSLNRTYSISQGPGGAFSHIAPYQEAADINAHYDSWYRDPNKEAYLVLATHPGTVVISDSNGVNGGNRIRIKDTCGGDFMTGYEHMLVNYVKVGDNVQPGTPIGVLGNTGVCTNCPHVHYVFRNGNGTHKPEDQSIPPILKKPYVPKEVPKYCSFNTNRCNVNVP